MIRGYEGIRPRRGRMAWVDPSAQAIGDVAPGEEVSVWMNAGVRGDVRSIRIGDRTNVQDGSVLHVTARRPTVLAEYEETYRTGEENR